MWIVSSAVHTVAAKRWKFASGDRDAREILCEKNFFRVLEEGGGGGWRKNIEAYRILKVKRKFQSRKYSSGLLGYIKWKISSVVIVHWAFQRNIKRYVLELFTFCHFS
jgi:hypothetical protein